MIKYFATFGGGQLPEFNINPMKVMVYIPNAEEAELRVTLRMHDIISNNYCTTYPVSDMKHMEDDYGMYKITLDELMEHYNG